jgi:hypothetical protein
MYSVALPVTHMYKRKQCMRIHVQRENEEAKLYKAKLDEAKLAFEQVWFEHTHIAHSGSCIRVRESI